MFKFIQRLPLQRNLKLNFGFCTQTPVPLWEQPYNPEKYEVIDSRIKRFSGYALLDVEPFPRAIIMKISYTILHKLKQLIPEDHIYRIFTEEKVKHIMKLTDEIDDIRQLEVELGYETLELFIQEYRNEISLVDDFHELAPWDPDFDKKGSGEMFEQYLTEMRENRVVPETGMPIEQDERDQTQFLEDEEGEEDLVHKLEDQENR